MKLEIELDLPDDMLDEKLQKHLRTEAVLRLFAERKIASSLAGRLLGLTRVQFMELIAQRGIPLVTYTAADFREDLEDVQAVMKDTRGQ